MKILVKPLLYLWGGIGPALGEFGVSSIFANISEGWFMKCVMRESGKIIIRYCAASSTVNKKRINFRNEFIHEIYNEVKS